MSFLRLCKDDVLVNLIRETFNANPVRVPEERIMPMTILGVSGKKVTFLGSVVPLLSGKKGLKVKQQKSQLPNVSASKSKAISTEIALKIMDGFLSGLGSNSAGLEHSFKGINKVSFSFQDVNRHHVDVNELLKVLGTEKLDKEHPVAKAFINESMRCVIITSVITSSSFTIKSESDSLHQTDLNIPEIQGLFSSKGNKVKVSSASKAEVSFKGSKDLAFAFSGLGLIISDDGSVDLDNEEDKIFLTTIPEDKKEEIALPFFLDHDFDMIEIISENNSL